MGMVLLFVMTCEVLSSFLFDLITFSLSSQFNCWAAFLLLLLLRLLQYAHPTEFTAAIFFCVYVRTRLFQILQLQLRQRLMNYIVSVQFGGFSVLLHPPLIIIHRTFSVVSAPNNGDEKDNNNNNEIHNSDIICCMCGPQQKYLI